MDELRSKTGAAEGILPVAKAYVRYLLCFTANTTDKPLLPIVTAQKCLRKSSCPVTRILCLQCSLWNYLSAQGRQNIGNLHWAMRIISDKALEARERGD